MTNALRPLRTYIINARRVERARSCREAEAQAGARGIAPFTVRVIDDMTQHEIADVVARIVKLEDPSETEADFVEAHKLGALEARKTDGRYVLSEEQRETVRARF